MRSSRGQRRVPALRRGDCQQPTEVVDYASQHGGVIPTFGVSPVTARPSAVVRARGTAMGYAKYVGRVGALAVALGFGAAIATSTPGIAFADGTEPDPVQGTNQDNTPATDPGPPAPEPDPTPPTPPGGTPSPGENNPQQENNNDPVKPGDPEVRSAEPGEVLATGGYIEDEKKPEEKPVLPTGTPPPTPPVAEQHIPTVPPVEESKNPVILPQTPLLLEDEKSKNKLLEQPSDEHLKTTLKTIEQQENTGQLQRLASLNNAQSLNSNMSLTSTSSTNQDENAPVMQTMAAAEAPVSTTPSLRTVFTGFLALIGLGPTTGAGTPSLPFVGTPIFEAIFAFVRRIESTLSNETPTAKVRSRQDPSNGQVTGQVEGDDADDDTLTYAVTTQPTHGHVDIDSKQESSPTRRTTSTTPIRLRGSRIRSRSRSVTTPAFTYIRRARVTPLRSRSTLRNRRPHPIRRPTAAPQLQARSPVCRTRVVGR